MPGKRKARAMLILLLISIILLQQAQLGIVSSAESISLIVNVPAVKENDRGVKGDVIQVRVELKVPGSGRVSVRAGGEVDNTTMTSMKMAVMVAALLAGVDWNSFDTTISLETQGDVAGPSGSLAISIAVYSILAGTGYRLENASITGAVSPDGLASRVGGVNVKCRASIDKGLHFYYPLANYTERLREECVEGRPVSSVVNATLTLAGFPRYSVDFIYKPPIEFNESMRKAARYLANETRKLMVSYGINSVEGGSIEERLRIAENRLDTHPYAAASFAYSALFEAYRMIYGKRLLEAGDMARESMNIIEEIDSMLDMLEENLTSMTSEGSIYYVEFLSTAYTRLAAARSSLEEAKGLVEARSPVLDVIVNDLAHARARVDSIIAWIMTARMLKDVGPRASEGLLERIVERASEYSKTSVSYATSLVEYIGEVYPVNRDELKAYLSSIAILVEKADEYRAEGNNIAALGFYREALSQSLSRIFNFPATKGELVIKGYLDELKRLIATINSYSAMRGIISGLSLAYIEYSSLMYNVNKAQALGLMEEAMASAMIWMMGVIQPTSLTGGLEEAGITSTEKSPVIEDPAFTISLAAATYLLGLLVAAKYASTLYRRIAV